MQHNNLRE